MTAVAIVTLDSTEARALTDQIKTGVEACWQLITRAYTECAWTALGYSSWDDYCTREFGTSRLRLPREERQEVVSSLRESGLSIRAIASATGLADKTVQRDLKPRVVNDYTSIQADELAEELIAAEPPGGLTEDSPGQTDRVREALDHAKPATIIGIDGKRYQPAPSRPPRKPQRPITDIGRDLGLDADKLADRIERFAADQRLSGKKNEVAPRLRHYLVHLIEAIQNLDHLLTPGE